MSWIWEGDLIILDHEWLKCLHNLFLQIVCIIMYIVSCTEYSDMVSHDKPDFNLAKIHKGPEKKKRQI